MNTDHYSEVGKVSKIGYAGKWCNNECTYEHIKSHPNCD